MTFQKYVYLLFDIIQQVHKVLLIFFFSLLDLVWFLLTYLQVHLLFALLCPF